MNIHHVGYVVRNLDSAISKFLSLGYDIENDVVYDDSRKIKICFITNEGHRIELIESVDESSPVSRMYKKVGPCPYHICYECEDIGKRLTMLKSEGWVQMTKKSEAMAIGNRMVIFLYHREVGMIELVEV